MRVSLLPFPTLRTLHAVLLTLGTLGGCHGDGALPTTLAKSPPQPAAGGQGEAEVAPPPEPEHSNAPEQPTPEAPPTLARAVPGTDTADIADLPEIDGDQAEEPTGGSGGDLAAASEVRKVLIIGDSIAATGFGALLERKLDAHPQVTCFRRGKSSSGLARPDFFDWPAEAKRQVAARQPDLVVVIMGGNDGQDLVQKKGPRVSWNDEQAWRSDYRARIDQLLDDLTADGRSVLWLGLPTMGLRSLERKLTVIRDVQRQAIEARASKATYIDTVPMVTDDKGELLTEAPVGRAGRVTAIRAEDRIHFTMSGSEYFADRVYPEVLRVLDLPEAPNP